jgi:hypothetical protein
LENGKVYVNIMFLVGFSMPSMSFIFVVESYFELILCMKY